VQTCIMKKWQWSWYIYHTVHNIHDKWDHRNKEIFEISIGSQIRSMPSCEKKLCGAKKPGWKRYEIKSGNQEMAVMVGLLPKF